ncbi:hypothetical protein [Robertkochia sediminum]|uniref:hypothetical protein n=1 Tax=Robertkochia sediminum TaxID=2785326 RepID=UPI00193280DB|nr:hypothetical protein [Robertkochia sediminum]MBL7472946.1 hypothetical protein [Robertkochia sediminum]
MKNLLYILCFCLTFSCQQAPKKDKVHEADIENQNYWRHLDYLIQLKNDVAKKHWQEFGKKDNYQPVVYYTHEGTYVLHPNKHILSITENQKMDPLKNVERIKLSAKYTDTLNFNFSTSYTDTDSTSLHFRENVLYFQSFDLTKDLIGIKDLQDWSIMVIHELFHGYQRAVPQFKAYYTNLDIPGGPDEFLGKYHSELAWFKESIHQENEILKSIWIDDTDLISGLKAYDSLRTIRLERIKNEFGTDIREAEDYEILMEGHARYFESLCKRYLSEHTSDTHLLREEDLALITNMFKGYDIKLDKGLYDIYNDRYYYQLGYNISMILEKYLPQYKETIYTKEHNFNSYLETLSAREEATVP